MSASVAVLVAEHHIRLLLLALLVLQVQEECLSCTLFLIRALCLLVSGNLLQLNTAVHVCICSRLGSE